jgi:hypothetical protein
MAPVKPRRVRLAVAVDRCIRVSGMHCRSTPSLIKQTGRQICRPAALWRWRESNPRPKDSTTSLYRLSLAISSSSTRPHEAGSPADHPRCLRFEARQLEQHPGICVADNARRQEGLAVNGSPEGGRTFSLDQLTPREGERCRCDWHLLFLRCVYENGATRRATCDQLPPSKPVIPRSVKYSTSETGNW